MTDIVAHSSHGRASTQVFNALDCSTSIEFNTVSAILYARYIDLYASASKQRECASLVRNGALCAYIIINEQYHRFTSEPQALQPHSVSAFCLLIVGCIGPGSNIH